MKNLILAVAVGLVLIVGTASATPVCTLGANVLSLPDPCEFGGLIFSDWGVFPAGLTSADVFFGPGSFVAGGTVYVQFQVVHSPSPVLSFADILLHYAVSGLLMGVDIFLGSHDPPVAIIENVCAVPFSPPKIGACPPGNLAAYTVSSGNPFAQAFFAPQQKIYIKKDIQILGSSANPAAISDFVNSHHVPEPVTLSLTGLGLLAAGWLGRRRVRG